MSECKESYAEYLEKLNNKIDENEPIITYNSKLSNSLQLGLECMTSKSQTGHVGKAANSSNTACQQHTLNENPALIQPAGCNMFNVQLNYNYNQAQSYGMVTSMWCLFVDQWNIWHQTHKISRNPSLEYEDTF